MKNTKSIEEQVAELTEEQQNKLVKVGFWGTLGMCVVVIPLLLPVLFGLIIMITNPLIMTDAAFYGFIILCIIECVVSFGLSIAMKIICPYYSDRKYLYIKKMRRKK